MLRQHSIPHIVQTAAGKFRLSGTGMLAVPSASFTPTSNLSLYMSARSFRIFGTAVHFYFDLSGRRAALASCPEKGDKSGNPMPLRFPSGYPQRFNILSGGHSLNAPRVHRADTVQSSPTRAPHFLRIVTIIGGPELSQNLIGEQVRSCDPEDSSGGLIRENGSAGLFILSHSGECAAPANFTRPTPEPPLHSLFNESAEFFVVERPQERAGINTTAAAMPLCFRPFFFIEQYRARRQ